MRKLLLAVAFGMIGLGIQSQNITVEDLEIYAPSNSTNEGESLPIGSSLNLSNNGISVDCLFEFSYLISNGAMPSNVSVQEVLNIPSTANSSSFVELGPIAFSNFTFPNPGDVNVTVEASAINCTLTNQRPATAGRGLFVFAAAPIPTLGQWGIMILGILIILFGVLQTKSYRVSKVPA